jgi:hypothetical protein
MKNTLFASSITFGVIAILALASSAPAQQAPSQRVTPATKTKLAAPVAKTAPAVAGSPALATPAPTASGNASVRAPSSLLQPNRMAIVRREPGAGQLADQDVCLHQNANFTGWKYCSNLRGLQTLPQNYQGQATSMTVPEGYLLRLFQRPDRTGKQCVFYGQVRQVAPDCDNMTAAISLEPDPEWPAKLAEIRRQRASKEAEEERQRLLAIVQAEQAAAQEEERRIMLRAERDAADERDRQRRQREVEAAQEAQRQAEHDARRARRR